VRGLFSKVAMVYFSNLQKIEINFLQATFIKFIISLAPMVLISYVCLKLDNLGLMAMIQGLHIC